MDKAEFDRFADAYEDQHRENIAVTGEGPEYFAEYKIRALREIVNRACIEAKRICDFGSGIGNSIPYFQRYFPETALTSSDVSERSLALGRQRYPEASNCVLIENDRIPVEADSFDVVFGLRFPPHPARRAPDVAAGIASHHAAGRTNCHFRA